jgi:hypothetical protein
MRRKNRICERKVIMKNLYINSKKNLSLNKLEETLINFLNQRSEVFFCKKSTNNPSCHRKEIRSKKKKENGAKIRGEGAILNNIIS